MMHNIVQRQLEQIQWFEEQELAYCVVGKDPLGGEGDDEDEAYEARIDFSHFEDTEDESSVEDGDGMHGSQIRVVRNGNEDGGVEDDENEVSVKDPNRNRSEVELSVKDSDPSHDSQGVSSSAGIDEEDAELKAYHEYVCLRRLENEVDIHSLDSQSNNSSAYSGDEDKENEHPHDANHDTVEAQNNDISLDDHEAVENLIHALEDCQMLDTNSDSSDKTMSISSISSTSSSDKENNPNHVLSPGQPSGKFVNNLLFIKQTCLTSPAWAPLIMQLRTMIADFGINKLVVLALGSIYRHYSYHGNWLLELGFVFAIQQLIYEESLRVGNDAIPALIFQDPDFTTYDITLLNSLGCAVVPHPIGLHIVDANTFVHARCPPWPLLYEGVLQTRPAVLLTGPLTPSVEARKFLREDEVYRGWVLYNMVLFLEEREVLGLEEVVLGLGEGIEGCDWLEGMRGYVVKMEEAVVVEEWLKRL